MPPIVLNQSAAAILRDADGSIVEPTNARNNIDEFFN
jgi:hypothetical protein